ANQLCRCAGVGGINTSGGLLTAGKLQEFAVAGRFEEMVAALSLMSNVPTAVIEQNMRDTQAESLLVFAKAIGLSWETTRSIMVLAAKRHRRSPAAVDQAMPRFIVCDSQPRNKSSTFIEPACPAALRHFA
ncbi:MAG: DUF2336 domain-containing protein, partial [Pseudolabrys sp.]